MSLFRVLLYGGACCAAAVAAYLGLSATVARTSSSPQAACLVPLGAMLKPAALPNFTRMLNTGLSNVQGQPRAHAVADGDER